MIEDSIEAGIEEEIEEERVVEIERGISWSG
jgi:hypothetical protein